MIPWRAGWPWPEEYLFKGTLGLLLDAKRAGHITAVRPSLDRLQDLGFLLARQTRVAVLNLAGEY